MQLETGDESVPFFALDPLGGFEQGDARPQQRFAGIEPQAAEISMVPQNYIKLEGVDAKTMMKLYDALDDNDDVQKVYANFDIDESEME